MKGNRVLVIGLDGASPLILYLLGRDKKFKKGLREILLRGLFKELISTIPPLSAPAWTTIFSGFNPGEHGIYDFISRMGSTTVVHSSKSLQGKMIWDRPKTYDQLKTILVNVPLTYPPYKINGIMVSGFPSPINTLCAYPKVVEAKLRKKFPNYMVDIPFINPNYTGIDVKSFVYYVYRLTLYKFKLTEFLLKNYDWNLSIVVFTELDRLQHVLWGYVEEYCSGKARTDLHERYYNLLVDYYLYLDEIIGKLLDLVGKETNIIVVSDHGFEKLEGYLGIYEIVSFLAEGKKGLQNPLKQFAGHFLRNLFEASKKYNLGILTRYFYKLPIKLQTAFLPNTIAEAHFGGIRFSEHPNLKESRSINKYWLTNKLKELKNRKIYGYCIPIDEVFFGDELYKGVYTKYAPEIVIIPKKGWKPVKNLGGKIIEKKVFAPTIATETGIHQSNFARRGVLLACGPDIDKEKLQAKNNVKAEEVCEIIRGSLGVS